MQTNPPVPARESWIPETVERLKTKPGEWEIVKTVPTHSAAASVRARLKARGADAVARGNAKGTVDIWARVG